MRTKGEESSITSSARASNSPDIPSTTGSALPPTQRSEICWYLNIDWLTTYTESLMGHLSLQDLGDLQQLYMILHEVWAGRDGEFSWKMKNFLDEALSNREKEIMTWARRHEADGRYRDAEYLIRRADPGVYKKKFLKYMWSHLDQEVLPKMVSIYENMGDWTAAEMCQERLVKQLFAETPGISNFNKALDLDRSHAVTTLSRLLSNFHKRVLAIVPKFGAISLIYKDFFITSRAAALDIPSLNARLIEQGLICTEPIEENNITSLHIAAKENAINLARQLIEMGADVNSRDARWRTPLHIAAKYAGLEIIELLVNNKAKVEAVDDFDYTPLHAAVVRKRPQDAVAYLVNAKAHINAIAGNGTTALNLALQCDLPAIASLLLEQRANVGASGHARAPLFAAVKHDRIWAVDLLLDSGANLLEKDREGYNVLEVAVKTDRESIFRILLDRIEQTRSASPEKNDYEGLLVLHCAIETANVSMVEMLLKARIGIRARDHNGDTALHRAILSTYLPQVVLILSNGRDAHDIFPKEEQNLPPEA